MKVTETHPKLTEEDKRKFIEEITRKMLEIAKQNEKSGLTGKGKSVIIPVTKSPERKNHR